MFILKLILWFLIGYSIYKLLHPTVKIFIDKKDQKDYQKTLDERKRLEKNMKKFYIVCISIKNKRLKKGLG